MQNKCVRYWPNMNEKMEKGPITITHISEATMADYDLREFTISHQDFVSKTSTLCIPSMPTGCIQFMDFLLIFNNNNNNGKLYNAHTSAQGHSWRTII